MPSKTPQLIHDQLHMRGDFIQLANGTVNGYRKMLGRVVHTSLDRSLARSFARSHVLPAIKSWFHGQVGKVGLRGGKQGGGGLC